MALLSTISEANRVVSQGNTWTVESQLIFVYLTTTTTNGVTTTTTHSVWKSHVHLAKRYAYVGMTETAAKNYAEAISNAYVKTQTKYALTYDKSSKAWGVRQVSNVEALQASVTPTRVEGNVWQIEVDVAAEAEVVTDKTDTTSPSVSDLKGYLSNVADFPEGSNPTLPTPSPGGSS